MPRNFCAPKLKSANANCGKWKTGAPVSKPAYGVAFSSGWFLFDPAWFDEALSRPQVGAPFFAAQRHGASWYWSAACISYFGLYSEIAAKQPPINVEENQKILDKLSIQAGIQAGIECAAEISRRRAAGKIRFPKGVFRFKTVEEADEWKNKILAGIC